MALGPIDMRVPAALAQDGRTANVPARAQTSQAPPANAVRFATPAPAQADQTAAKRQDVESAARKANDFVQASAREIEFTVDDSTGETVVKVVDQATNQVIRQIPSQEMLEIAQALDQLQGLLVKQKA
jgi:flagellar protein FlaG